METLPNTDFPRDAAYLALILQKVEICRAYQPKFGQGNSVALEKFRAMYGSDPFYSWFGLDNPLMYAAHKAAGGITSLYRQIGIGCEQLWRQIIRDQLGLTAQQAAWSYQIAAGEGKNRTLSLDGRIKLEHLSSNAAREKVAAWLRQATEELQIAPGIAQALKGAVFEVRQGYKSKDSKRQNADIGNAGMAYVNGYLPVVFVFSTQIDADVAARYRNAGWLLLQGHLTNSPVSSTYAFCEQVLGYDLAGFLHRNSAALKEAVEAVLTALLSPDEGAKGSP
jgi:hypothetical protein